MVVSVHVFFSTCTTTRNSGYFITVELYCQNNNNLFGSSLFLSDNNAVYDLEVRELGYNLREMNDRQALYTEKMISELQTGIELATL